MNIGAPIVIIGGEELPRINSHDIKRIAQLFIEA